jgi:hypothetical protein
MVPYPEVWRPKLHRCKSQKTHKFAGLLYEESVIDTTTINYIFKDPLDMRL